MGLKNKFNLKEGTPARCLLFPEMGEMEAGDGTRTCTTTCFKKLGGGGCQLH